MPSQVGETKGILNLFRTTTPLIKPATPTTSPRTPDGSTFKTLATPPVTPRSPSTPRNLPSEARPPDHRLPETPASGSVPGNIAPSSPRSEDSVARKKSRSSVSKATRPRGSIITEETKKSRSIAVEPRVPKATVARVSTVIRQINLIRNDVSQEDGEESKTWSLNPDEYDHLLSRIRQNKDTTLRAYLKERGHEYSTSWNQFSIRMPSEPLHSIFSSKIGQLIEKKMAELADGKEGHESTSSQLRTAAANVDTKGDSRLKFHGVKDRKAPDASYYFLNCVSEKKEVQAPFIVEVNWANLSSEKLAEKAQQYIQLSNGNVRTVVNIDMNQIYQNSNNGKDLEENEKGPAPAYVSVWRAYDREGGGQQAAAPRKDFEKPFRDAEGEPGSDFELALFLSDFVCQECADTLPGCTGAKITITAEELCIIYGRAVKAQINDAREFAPGQAHSAQPQPGKLQRVREGFRRRSERIRNMAGH